MRVQNLHPAKFSPDDKIHEISFNGKIQLVYNSNFSIKDSDGLFGCSM